MSELDAGFDLATAGHDAWLQPLKEWPEAIRCWLQSGRLQSERAVTRIVVACVRGSAPREAGTCMLVSNSRILGTIGGGHLEWVAIDTARQLLNRCGESPVRVQRLVLGADLAQCCGGVVDLWIERYTQSDVEFLDRVVTARRRGGERLVSKLTAQGVERQLMPKGSADEEWGPSSLPRRTSPADTAADSGTLVASTSIPTLHPQIHFAWPGATDATLTESLDEPLPSIWLYGAGHVGQALSRVLATLPARTTWIDSRRDLLPDEPNGPLEIRNADRPELTVPDAAPQTHFIVMTHDHALDYTLCRLVLERGDFASLGVIGSKSKAARFRSRLARDGLTPERIAQMRCPIGIDGLKSKLPAVIAVAVAAQLLQAIEARVATIPTSSAGVDCEAAGAACRTCGLLHRAS